MRRFGESPEHEKQKERCGQIIASVPGWYVWVDNFPVTCKTDRGQVTFWPDIYAEDKYAYAYETEAARSLHPRTSRPHPIYPESTTQGQTGLRDSELLAVDSTRSGEVRQTGGRKAKKPGRRIILEVQGPGGHISKASHFSERNRLLSIEESLGRDIEYYEVSIPSHTQVQLYRRRHKTNNRPPFDIRTWTPREVLTHCRIS
jgi:hypothetical protein